MNRTERLYALVEELRAVAPRPRSARWLAARFEVSTRTIERDLSALQQSGVPIWAEPGRTGGYCLDASHTLGPLGLTVDEALAVVVSLGMLDSSPFRGAARSALRKLVAVTEEHTLEASMAVAARVHLFEATRPARPSPDLSEALRKGGVLQICYVDREGETTTREVEPVACVGKDGHWYLVAWCRLRGAIRAFRGDRIRELSPTGEVPPRRSLHSDDLQVAGGGFRSLDPSDLA